MVAEQADELFGVYMVNEASRVVKTRLEEVVEAGTNSWLSRYYPRRGVYSST
jgi:hypothetical protein